MYTIKYIYVCITKDSSITSPSPRFPPLSTFLFRLWESKVYVQRTELTLTWTRHCLVAVIGQLPVTDCVSQKFQRYGLLQFYRAMEVYLIRYALPGILICWCARFTASVNASCAYLWWNQYYSNLFAKGGEGNGGMWVLAAKVEINNLRTVCEHDITLLWTWMTSTIMQGHMFLEPAKPYANTRSVRGDCCIGKFHAHSLETNWRRTKRTKRCASQRGLMHRQISCA